MPERRLKWLRQSGTKRLSKQSGREQVKLSRSLELSALWMSQAILVHCHISLCRKVQCIYLQSFPQIAHWYKCLAERLVSTFRSIKKVNLTGTGCMVLSCCLDHLQVTFSTEENLHLLTLALREERQEHLALEHLSTQEQLTSKDFVRTLTSETLVDSIVQSLLDKMWNKLVLSCRLLKTAFQ